MGEARSRPAPAALVLAALVLVLATACGTVAGGTAPPPPPAAGGLTGTVMQYRSDIAGRVLTVRLRAGTPVEVGGLEVQPAGFDAAPAVVKPVRLGRGNSVDVKSTYGPARCEEPPVGAGEVVVDVVEPGGSSRVRVPMEDEYGLISRLHTAECAQRAVRAQAEFSFAGGFTPDPAGQVVRGVLQLRRLAGDTDVAVVELGSTTLFALRAGPVGGPVVILPGGATDVSVPVEVETVRCDPHALAESKRATAFGMFVAVAGGDPVSIVVDPDDAARATLVQFATDSCAARR